MHGGWKVGMLSSVLGRLERRGLLGGRFSFGVRENMGG